jgi:NAD(P)-dependent dehydrogenase (short-subunit alcohol dehydrogenase family)
MPGQRRHFFACRRAPARKNQRANSKMWGGTDEFCARPLSLQQGTARGGPRSWNDGQEVPMTALNGRNVGVIGGSRGLGRVIVATAHDEGARVLAVARQAEPLAQLSRELPGVETLVIDATDEKAPAKVFEIFQPDVLVICGGAPRSAAPLHEMDWQAFTSVWENDVKASFLFCKAALRRPLSPGATVILISSGAAIGGSPISGGYAGAKRMQMFMANYAQKESDRLTLGLRFLALAPMRPMPETEGGKVAVEGYSKYLGIPASDFIKRMDSPQTPEDVARAVVNLATEPRLGQGNIFLVSGKGVDAMA